MPWATTTDGSFAGGVNTSSNKVIGLTFNLAQVSVAAGIGNVLFAAIAFDNAGTSIPTISSITKAATETADWVRLAHAPASSATANAAVRLELYGIRNEVAWTNVIPTVTFSGTATAKASSSHILMGGTMTPRGTLPMVGNSSTSGGAFYNFSGGSFSLDDLAVLAAGHESNSVPGAVTDTTNGTWINPTGTNTTGGSANTNVGVRLQLKIIETGVSGWSPIPASTGDCGATGVLLAPAVGNFRGWGVPI